MQMAVENVILIDQATVDACRAASVSTYRIFSDKASDKNDIHGNSNTYKLDEPYWIEVDDVQRHDGSLPSYESALKQCDKAPGTGWRVPIIVEYYAIWMHCKGTGVDATKSTLLGDVLKSSYLSASHNTTNGYLIRISMKTGKLNSTSTGFYSRCIREVKMK